MPKGTFPDSCCQSPHPCGEPLLTHVSTRDPPTLAGSFGSVSCEVTAPFLCLGTCKVLFVPSKTGVCFPQSYGSLVIKSCWPSWSDSLGIPSPFVRSPGWGAWCGVLNLHNGGRTSLVLLFSSLWVTQLAGMGLDFIMIVPLLLSCCGFFFVFGCRVPFLDGFWHPPMDGCSTASCDFGALTGGDEHTVFYSAILNWNLQNLPF